VERNLTVNGGTKLFGSVMTCSPPGSQAPITSGILCRGNVSLRYGVQPGMGVDDLMAFLTSQGDTSLKDVHEKYLSPLLASVAPNAAKIVGPFHPRLPYIAQFATTIGFAVIIPFPAPIPYDNVCVPIFRVLSYVYSISLNYTLGENLYPQSDWWIFGNGCVPVVPRVEPEGLVSALKGFKAPIPTLTDPGKFFQQQLEKFTENVCKALAKQVGTEILKMVAREVAGLLEGAKQAGDIANKAIGFIQQRIGDPLQGLTDDLKNQLEVAVRSTTDEYIEKPVRQVVEKAQQEVEAYFERAMLRNCPGLLVYAGGSLSVGTAGDPAALAAGMFVAGEHLTMECERTVGTLVSASGDVRARAFMYNPYFSHASLYQPKDSPDWTGLDWFTAGTRCEYAADQDSKSALEIGPPVYHVTAQGWTNQ